MSCGNVLLFLSRVYWLNLIHCNVVSDRILLCHNLLLVGDLTMLTDLWNSITSTHGNCILCKNMHVLRMWREILYHGNASLWIVVLATSGTEIESRCIFRVGQNILYWLGRVFSRCVLLCFHWGLTVTCHAPISRALSVHCPREVTLWTSDFWWSLRDYRLTTFVFEPLRNFVRYNIYLHLPSVVVDKAVTDS